MFSCLPAVQMLPLRTVTLHPSPLSHGHCHPVLYMSRSTSSFHLVELSFKGRADLIHYWNKLMGCSGFSPTFWCQSARFHLVPHLIAVWPNLLHKMRTVIPPTTLKECRIFHELFQEKGSEMFLESVLCTTLALWSLPAHSRGKGYCASRDEFFLVHLLKHILKPTLKMLSFFSALL